MKLIKKKKMKTINLFCKSVVILLFAGLSMNTVVAQTTKKETVTKVYDISPSGSLEITSRSANVEILTWDRNEVKVTGEITYAGNDNKEEIAKLLNAFKNIDAESSRNVLNLNLYPIKSSGSYKTLFRKAENITILNNGDKILIDANKVKFTYTIWIPATLNVKADCSFGKLKMATIRGNADIVVNNNDMEMGNFGASGIFKTRFSSITVGSGGTSNFDVNNGNVNAAELKNVTINARFSNFNIAKAHDVTIDLNNGTAVFGALNDINAIARFSTIRIESNANISKFDFNNSKLFGKNFQTMDVSARFSNFKASNIGNIKINSANNSNFDFGTVNTVVSRESRFSTFEFDEIVVNASFPDTNNSTVNINRTSDSFTGFSGNFRFGTVNLKIHPGIEYNLNYDGTFGQLNTISSDKFKTRLVSEKSGSKTTIQGVNAGAKCNIEIVANNTNCRIE